jgi:hypothetical protein
MVHRGGTGESGEAAMKTNPQFEIRDSKKIRSSKSESSDSAEFGVRHSDFGLPSDFDFRISDFTHAH